MRFDADLTFCADLVRRADPDRFMAVMAAPVEARPVLFAVFALCIEVARAPWVTQEPMIAQIRLQWWRDALAEIAAGQKARHHEVVTPLARLLSRDQAGALDEMVAVRHWDIERKSFEDLAHFQNYINQTSGTPMWIAAQVLGQADENVVRDFAYASGLANWLRAVPELRVRGRLPLPDASPEAISALALGGLDRLRRARGQRSRVSRAASAALLAGWQAGAMLQRAADDPALVDKGELMPGELRRRASLMKRVVTGRW